MWEFLTGARYTSADSDLDLVMDLPDACLADPAASFLAHAQAISPWSLDAELSFPRIGDVHWKEWHSGAETVLVKSLDAVKLFPRAWVARGGVP